MFAHMYAYAFVCLCPCMHVYIYIENIYVCVAVYDAWISIRSTYTYIIYTCVCGYVCACVSLCACDSLCTCVCTGYRGYFVIPMFTSLDYDCNCSYLAFYESVLYRVVISISMFVHLSIIFICMMSMGFSLSIFWDCLIFLSNLFISYILNLPMFSANLRDISWQVSAPGAMSSLNFLGFVTRLQLWMQDAPDALDAPDAPDARDAREAWKSHAPVPKVQP